METLYQSRSRWLAIHALPHESSLRLWLRRVTHLPDVDIDDLVQETYAILAKRDEVDTIRDPRSYMFQVAKSVFLQDLRRTKVVSIGSVADLAALDTVDDAPTPEQYAFGQHELHRVKAAIGTMPPQVRRVFWLRRVEGRSQRETAHDMGLAENTVEKHMSRGIKLLLRQFGHGGNARVEASIQKSISLLDSNKSHDQSRNG